MNSVDDPERTLPVEVIYSYDHQTNYPWIIPEYKVPREYLDPNRMVLDRAYASQKKGQKCRNYVTKKGYFLDYDLKIAATTPAPNKHNQNKPWSVEKLIERSRWKKIDKTLIKGTYIQEIENEQKKRKKPGVCTYKLQKSQKEKDKQNQQLKKKKISPGEKIYFHDDIRFLAGASPGSGQYNPHKTVQKINVDKTNRKHWIQKHKENRERLFKSESKIPAPGTYSPLNSTFSTFQLIMKKEKLAEKQKRICKGFGSDARFEYDRPVKKTIKEKRPSPMSYNTTYEWRASKSRVSCRSRPWYEAISKRVATISVYH